DASMILGDLTRQSIREIWNGRTLQELRRRFAEGRPIARPCANCQESSLEIGLPGRHYGIARLLRRRGIGRMNRSRMPAKESLSGPQNVNRRPRTSSPRVLEPVS
ncbi:MAG TPA: SPASM domain-containing protein, partial [Phycisphaerae bacterium]|nr:SPASM domain-containing protein [Phycisphaerae bacterium]